MTSHRQTIIFLSNVLIGIASCLLLFVAFRSLLPSDNGGRSSPVPIVAPEEEQTPDTKPIIWYIPGWLSENEPQDEAEEILQHIFPDSPITVKNDWKSKNDFAAAIQYAEIEATKQANVLKDMDPAKRERIILVGHSLGGMIVVRVMARLQEWGLHIRQGILLGAAESSENPDIGKAMYASQLPMINIWKRQDGILQGWYAKVTDPDTLAIGSYGYAEPFHPAYFRQYKCEDDSSDLQQETKAEPDKTENEKPLWRRIVEGGLDLADEAFHHYAKYYLLALEKEYPHFLESIPPLDLEMNPLTDRDQWDEVDSCLEENRKTTMEYNKKTKQYRVVSPNGVVIAIGDKVICERVFRLAVEWDASSSLKHVQDICRQIPGLSQDKKKIKIDLVDSRKEWETVRITHSWLLQGSKKDDLFRVVDPFDYERANGSEAEMKDLFAQLEKN